MNVLGALKGHRKFSKDSVNPYTLLVFSMDGKSFFFLYPHVVIPQYPQGIGSRTSTDMNICGCSSPLQKKDGTVSLSYLQLVESMDR